MRDFEEKGLFWHWGLKMYQLRWIVTIFWICLENTYHETKVELIKTGVLSKENVRTMEEKITVALPKNQLEKQATVSRPFKIKELQPQTKNIEKTITCITRMEGLER